MFLGATYSSESSLDFFSELEGPGRKRRLLLLETHGTLKVES